MPIINPTLPADGDDAIVSPYNTAIQAILAVINGAIDSDNLAAGSVGLSELSAAIQATLVPTGVINPYGGSSAPTGWLLCDGTSQLRASYSTLFAIIGTAFGSVDGTHFNLPDLRGRSLVGIDNLGGTAANRTQHTSTLTTVSGSPSATVGSATGLSVGMYITNANVPAGTTITVISGTTLTMSANATGNGTTVAARFGLLANDSQVIGAAGGIDAHVLITNQLASHTHNTDPAGNPIRGGAGTTANITTGGGSFVTGGGTADLTGSTGGDQSHPNLPPSLAVNYIIKT